MKPKELRPGTLAQAEHDHIVVILDAAHWNILAASRTLNISRTTLYRKMARYRIEGKRATVTP